ncbi:MAG: RDD family protein [Oceanicoccus sp.]
MKDSTMLAGRGRRFFATIIDVIVTPIVGVAIMLVTGILESAEAYASTEQTVARVLLLAISSYFVVHGWLLFSRSQSLGKSLLRIMIVDNSSGEPASFWKLILLRLWALPLIYLLAIPMAAIIPILDQAFIFGKSRRCLHDYLCSTKVVKRP